MHHPEARLEANHLVDELDGSAHIAVENELEHMVERGAVSEALHLDQVRREIERVYAERGEEPAHFSD